MSALNFGGLETEYPEYTEYARSRYVVLPIPYDQTSTWHQGADKGPAAILHASANMELYDIETRSEPFLAGIHTAEALLCDAPPDVLYEQVRDQVRHYIADGKFVLTLGGNHCVPIGSCQAACEAYERERVSILQIDAHSDLRESYQGNAYSHACAMARMQRWAKPVGVGIRSMDSSERENIDKADIFLASDLHRDPHWIDKVMEKLEDKVYLTIDLDGLDPSIMPATGTPEPGGLGWYQVMDLLTRLFAEKQVLSADIVELCPRPELFHADFLAAKLAYKILALHYRAEHPFEKGLNKEIAHAKS